MDEPPPPPASGRPGEASASSDAGATAPAAPSAEGEMSAALLDGTRSLAPRRRHRAGTDEAIPASADVEILTLTGRLQELIAHRREQEAQPAATPASTRLRPRAQRAVPPAEEQAVVALADARESLPAMEARRRPTGPSAEERLEAATARWGRLGGRLLAFLVLPAAAFLLGRLSAPASPRSGPEPAKAEIAAGTRAAGAAPNNAPTPAPPRWTTATLARLEEVFTSLREGGDLNRPAVLLRELRDAGGPLPGLDLLIGEMNLRAGHAQEVVATLLPLYRMDPPVAAAGDQLGFLSARGRKLDEAADYFAAAAGADPISGLYFHHWGEALRRQGKVAEAITRFEQALRRGGLLGVARPAPPGAALRLNLARLEAGQGADVRREAEERQKKLPPSSPELGQTLVALAAADLQEGRHAEAGAHLAKARDLLANVRAAGGAPEFEVLLNDYFFRAFAGRPELAGVIPPAGSGADARRVAALTGSAEVYFIDP